MSAEPDLVHTGPQEIRWQNELRKDCRALIPLGRWGVMEGKQSNPFPEQSASHSERIHGGRGLILNLDTDFFSRPEN